ncbi:hypothetical protein C6T68_29400 [Burkholderia multivorans]|nr:hypothetical protein C6T68_29400 [Burkholderia multivorans]
MLYFPLLTENHAANCIWRTSDAGPAYHLLDGLNSRQDMDTTAPPTHDGNKDDLIKLLLSASAKDQTQEVVEQYSEKLVSILNDLRATGYSTSRVENELVAGLLNKDTGGYINHACELAAAGYFMGSWPQGFRYQVKNTTAATQPNTGAEKNFDFSFVADGYVFNVEVKTFTPTAMDYDAPPIKSFLPRDSTKALHAQGMRFARNRAPAIKRFLEDANSQLVRPEGGISVVMLCCNDPDEYADALTCLIGPHGIYYMKTTDGFMPSPLDLPNIDAVVMCYLGMNHSAVVDPRRFRNIFRDDSVYVTDGGADLWDYSKSLPAGFFLRHECRPDGLLEAFPKAFNSHHVHLWERMRQNEQDIQEAVFDLFNDAYKVRERRDDARDEQPPCI